MITYLQKIRHKLLDENRLSKYLLYATGEILLVVIGILIAVSVNNYSEKKKAISQSKLYLTDMLEDLASDTAYLNKMILNLEEQLKIEDWLLNKQSLDISDLDSIRLSVTNINWTFTINDRSFQNIQNSTNTKLAGYEQLYSEVSKYYLVTKTRISLNNQTELLESTKKSGFEEVLSKNLLITSRQYLDYTGVQVQMEMPSSENSGNLNAIFSSLSEIETKNTLYDKNARHNYIFTAVFMCNFEAKNLIRKIEDALNKEI